MGVIRKFPKYVSIGTEVRASGVNGYKTVKEISEDRLFVNLHDCADRQFRRNEIYSVTNINKLLARYTLGRFEGGESLFEAGGILFQGGRFLFEGNGFLMVEIKKSGVVELFWHYQNTKKILGSFYKEKEAIEFSNRYAIKYDGYTIYKNRLLREFL